MSGMGIGWGSRKIILVLPEKDEKMIEEHEKFNENARKLVAEHYGLAV